MNNKGFAITGIIYTLFVLFLMILLSVLSGLSASQRMIISSVENLDKDLSGTKIEDTTEINQINDDGITTYFGKYIFTITTNSSVKCSAYLEKNVDFKNADITFSPKDCDDYVKTIDWWSSTSGCSNANGCIKLIEIYNFEEES